MKKQIYLEPAIEEIEMAVEAGIANSTPDIDWEGEEF